MVQCGALGGMIETPFQPQANCGNQDRLAHISYVTFFWSPFMAQSVLSSQPTKMRAGWMHIARWNSFPSIDWSRFLVIIYACMVVFTLRIVVQSLSVGIDSVKSGVLMVIPSHLMTFAGGLCFLSGLG